MDQIRFPPLGFFGVVADVPSGGVAYLAHIAGMIFGVVTARLFEKPLRLAEQQG